VLSVLEQQLLTKQDDFQFKLMSAFDETKRGTQENSEYVYHQIKIWHETWKGNVYGCYGLKNRDRCNYMK